MFLAPTKTLMIEALQQVYGTADALGSFPITEFRGIWISMEYPDAEADYPGIWVTFLPTAPLQVSGIGHRNYTDPDPDDGTVHSYTKWRFAGVFSFTCVAMTSLERDRLADSLIEVLAFGVNSPETAPFHTYLDQNDLVGLQMNWDQFTITAPDESQGTPWGTDDPVYEVTVNVDCEGEFASDPSVASMIPLSAILVTDYAPGETEPSSGTPSVPPADTDWQ